MTLTAATLRTASGAAVQLGEVLGRGGEARVHALVGDTGRAVKIYAQPDAERARKLAAMIAKVPNDPDRKVGHVSIAWPQSLVLDGTGRAVGFLMPRIDARRYLPLHQLYHPRSRRNRAPGISWRYLVRIARNLCGTLAALHEADYVVGDLNESNILVDDRALVTLVDLDSIQVASGNRVFRCTVGKGEYTPPELQGRSFRESTRRPSSDRFGLAVLIFLLLMEGNHPFTGVFGGEGEPPGLEENIRSRRSPYFGARSFEPPPAAPPIEILGPELSGLLKRALLGQPWRRPDARELKRALATLEEGLVQCESSVAHSYRKELHHCPWCRRTSLLGSDPYPLEPIPASDAGQDRARAPVTAAAGQLRSMGAGRGTPVATTAVRSPAAGRRSPPTAAPPSSGQKLSNQRNGRDGGNGRNGRKGQTVTPRTLPDPTRARLAGFRGSWLQFHARLPLLSLTLLALFASPAHAWHLQLRSLLGPLIPGPGGQVAVLASLVLLPALALSTGLYLRARRRSEFALALIRLERVVRAAVAAGLLSLLASLAAGLALGRGSVLAGDWLLLPSFWVVAFVISLRFVGPHRY